MRKFPDFGIRSRRHIVISHVGRFVASGYEPTRETGWQLRADEKPHQATRSTG